MFTFLNTIILSALALSLIPVLIHLLNRKKSQLIPFSTLEFLKTLQKKKMKKIKIRQILLLILRTMILLLAVIAFARPVSKMENQGRIDAHEKTSVVIIVDNSVGTSYISEKGMVLDAIKNKTEQILNYLEEGDEAIIIFSSGSSEEYDGAFTHNFTELKALVKDASFSYAKSDINEALFLANKKFESARNANQEIYVLTAFQASSFTDEKVNLQSGIRPIFVDCSVKEFRNIGIRSVQVVSKILEVNKPLEVRVVVKNFGDNDVQEILLNAYLDGRRVGQTSLAISAGDESVVDMKIIVSKSGYIQGSVEIDDDPLNADNKRYFHVFVPSRINVLLAGNKPSDVNYIKLALNPTAHSNALIQIKTANAMQLSIENLSDFDIIVLSNIPRFDDAFMRKLDKFLSSGKGLMILPGSDADIPNYNILLQKIGFGRLLNLSDNSAQSSVYLKFGKIDYSHPIIYGMFDQNITTDQTLDSPNFIKFFKVSGNASSQTLIAYSNNEPFMEESSSKKFSALLFTSEASLSWSDWPIKGIFVPLMNRSMQYLYSSNHSLDGTFNSGDPVELRLRATSDDNISLLDPNGTELKPKIKQIGEDILVSVPSAETPGTYKILQRGDLKAMLDVNMAPNQVNFKKLEPKKLSETILSQFQMVRGTDNLEDVILQSRYGVELRKWFVIGVLALLIAETLVSQSHRFTKE